MQVFHKSVEAFFVTEASDLLYALCLDPPQMKIPLLGHQNAISQRFRERRERFVLMVLGSPETRGTSLADEEVGITPTTDRARSGINY